MKKTILIVLIAAGFLSCWARAEIIRLKNGVELQCEILESNEELGLKVKRLDNGGVFDLRWEHILDADIKKIKYSRGYTDEDAKVILYKAKRVELRNGTYEDGIQVESNRPGTICLRRRGKLYHFSQNQVKDITNIEMEARDLYTMEELYNRKMAEGSPGTISEFFALGVFCESVTYYEKALEIYKQVVELDPGYKPDVMTQKIGVMEARIEETDATNLLDEIKQLIYKRKFARSLELIAKFEEDFPDSVQVGRKEKLKGDALIKRHAFYQQKILTDYRTYMDKVARKVAMNKELGLDEALEFAVEEMGNTIRTKLSEAYGLPIEEVEELWTNRKGGTHRTSTYGTGTFILGPERAKRMPEKEEEGKGEEDEEQEKPLTLDERLKKRIEEIKKQKDKNKGKRKSRIRMDEIGRTPEAWWTTEPTSNRQRFLISFYAEESGDMKILRVKLNPCPSCNGKGWLEQISATSDEDQKYPCEVCKTLGIERTITFK